MYLVSTFWRPIDTISHSKLQGELVVAELLVYIKSIGSKVQTESRSALNDRFCDRMFEFKHMPEIVSCMRENLRIPYRSGLYLETQYQPFTCLLLY